MWIWIFKNELHVGRIFEILKKLFFVFPIVHQHVNLTILPIEDLSFFLKILPQFWWNSPILDTKIYIKNEVCFTYGWFDTKKWLFFIMFFSISPTCSYFFIQKLRQNEVTYCENDNEKFFKNWKNHEIFS